MKRLINNVLLSAVMGVLFAACQSGGSENDTRRTNEQILQAVTEVDAIGKVVPAGDWALISGPVAARIERLVVQAGDTRSEEHTSELQSLMRISYAVFCLKKKKT